MADMKQIFTYPLNSGTDYIDPLYIGDANSGLTRRVDDLLDETYKSWSNLDPVSDLGTTTSEAMENMSKYINYYGDNQWIENLTFNDFWYQPLVVMNKRLIAADATIQLGDTNNPSTITTTADHDFQDYQIVRLTGLNGSWQSVIGTQTDYYVKRISNTELQISKNSQLSDLIGFISTQTIDVQSDLRETNQVVQFVFPTNYAYPNGMAVDVNTVQFNGQTMVGNTYYTKSSSSGVNVYDMYEDSALTNPLMVSEIIPFTQEQFSGVLNVDNAVLTIDTSGDPITSNETKGFATSQLTFAGTNDSIPNGTTNMLHLKSTSTSQLWEVYDDPDYFNPEGGVVNRDREWGVIGHTSGNHLYSDSSFIRFYNPYLWKMNDTDALVAQPPGAQGSNYNFAQLEGTTLWAGPSISSDNFANLYTDAALTQPLTRNSLNGDLFTYANNGLSSFPFETDTLTLTEDGTVPNSPVIAQQTGVWWSKTGVQDYVASGTRLYQDPSTHILYTDFSKTQPVEAQAFTTPVDADNVGVDWMPNGSPLDTAVIKIPNRAQVLERIQIQEYQNTTGDGNLLNVLIGVDIYLTHLGSQEYEMYLDAAKTQPVKFDLYKQSAPANPAINLNGSYPPILENNFGASSPGHNLVTSTEELNKNQLAFWLEDDVDASLGMGVTMFPGGRYYYLSKNNSYSNPWVYWVFNDAARTQPFNSPIEFLQYRSVSNIQDYNGFTLPYNGEQLFTSQDRGAKDIDYDVQTVTGNGQNFSNTIFYPSQTFSDMGYELYEDSSLTNPLTVGQINNNSAGLTATYQLSPSNWTNTQGTFDNGIKYLDNGGAQQHKSFNQVVSVDGDDDADAYYGKLRALASRKFIHSDTDRIDTDNKLLTQAGLLTDGDEYYIDFVYRKYGPELTGGHRAWGLFTSFNNSNAQPVYPVEQQAKDFRIGTETAWTTVDKFPDDLLEGDASLDYQLYSDFPYDANGDNILTTHGTIQDDGQTVTLNDPINHATTFGWFTITSHNNFADTIATNETLRLSPTEKVRYTGYTLNGDRLFELVDNNDTKIPVNLGNYPSTTVTVKNTDFLPAVQSYGSPSSGAADYVVGDHYSLHAIADSVTLDRRKPYVFWDASNNFYVGMWTGQKYTKPILNQPDEVYKNMMFWTKAGWANSERHLVDTAVPTTLYTQWFALAPTSTRTSSATFDYEDAFAFNNIAGEYSTTQTTPNGIPLDRNNGWALVQDYSIEGTEPTTEPGQPGQGNPGGNLPAAFTNANNTGYDQWMLSYDIVVPALQRHTMGTATSMLYVEEVVWGSPTFRSDGRQQVVAYNPTYNNTDTTPNPYYNYFNHGDIIDLPGIDGTGTAPYILLRRGDNTKLKYKYTTTSTPDPTGSSTDIVTEDMEGEVWGVIPLANWTGADDQGYSSGTWTNNSLWIPHASQLYTDQTGGTNYTTNSLNIFQQGPILALPMFSKFQPTHTYPNTYAVSTGAAYTGSVTVRAGNVATGTPYTSSQFNFITGKQHEQDPLDHTNKYKVIEETPWDLGTVPINTRPISTRRMQGYESIGGFTPLSDSAKLKRYITSTETHDLFGYEGRISFDSPCKLTSTAIDIRPAYTGDVNITFGITPVNTTQGTISLSPNQPQPYEADNVEIILPGNATYSYQDTNNVTQYGASIEANKWYEPGTNEITANTPNETDATFTVGLNGSGKLNSIALATNGRFDNGNQQLRQLQAFANQYNPPTPTPAELADVWDTDDEWTTNGFNTSKEWPAHVTPRSANIVYNSPTIVNNSQSGVKYTRSVGHTKWRLEVEYPPMNVEDFQKFHAIAQAAHGQSTPFFFRLQSADGNNILWRDMDGPTDSTTFNPLIKDAINPGDTTMLVEGFASNESDAFIRGEVFIDGENENGNLHTSLSETDSNIFGEAKIRTPWPFRQYNGPGTKVYKNPFHAVVTLADDNFEYSVDTNGYYFVSVAFDLDGWK